VVGFLIDDETLGTGSNEREVFGGFERAEFEGDLGHQRQRAADAVGDVAMDVFGMLASDDEEERKPRRASRRFHPRPWRRGGWCGGWCCCARSRSICRC